MWAEVSFVLSVVTLHAFDRLSPRCTVLFPDFAAPLANHRPLAHCPVRRVAETTTVTSVVRTLFRVKVTGTGHRRYRCLHGPILDSCFVVNLRSSVAYCKLNASVFLLLELLQAHNITFMCVQLC